MITITPDVLRDFDRCSELEWLETTGLGGWASSTVAGAHSRRYHGLLVAALHPPVNRMLLVSKLDETLHIDGASEPLASNRYPGVVHPDGHSRLTTFRRDLFPVFEWQVAGIELRKTVAGIHGENTTIVQYEVVAAPHPFMLELRPLLTWRDIHHLGPDAVISEHTAFDDHTLRWRPVNDGPEVSMQVPGARFEPQPDWFRRFEFEIERRRGFDFTEDLWTPGRILVELGAGDRLSVIISTEPTEDRDGDALLAAEAARRVALVDGLHAADNITRTLVLAADQFIVTRGEDLRTIIAGYHWFTDWGRDTMIALPGLCLATGRADDARRILRAFAASVDRGMLPNRFPDSGEAPEYNTVDATLWLFVAAHSYLQATGDLELVREELLPVLRDIIRWHDRGTRYRIRVDGDGLLLAGEPGVQLTWMDAKIGDWVVTPRHGKAVVTGIRSRVAPARDPSTATPRSRSQVEPVPRSLTTSADIGVRARASPPTSAKTVGSGRCVIAGRAVASTAIAAAAARVDPNRPRPRHPAGRSPRPARPRLTAQARVANKTSDGLPQPSNCNLIGQ